MFFVRLDTSRRSVRYLSLGSSITLSRATGIACFFLLAKIVFGESSKRTTIDDSYRPSAMFVKKKKKKSIAD